MTDHEPAHENSRVFCTAPGRVFGRVPPGAGRDPAADGAQDAAADLQAARAELRREEPGGERPLEGPSDEEGRGVQEAGGEPQPGHQVQRRRDDRRRQADDAGN